MLVIKREVLERLFSDPEFCLLASQCKSLEEFERLIVRFGKAKGFKIKELRRK